MTGQDDPQKYRHRERSERCHATTSGGRAAVMKMWNSKNKQGYRKVIEAVKKSKKADKLLLQQKQIDPSLTPIEPFPISHTTPHPSQQIQPRLPTPIGGQHPLTPPRTDR